jgi:hypothetical protein
MAAIKSTRMRALVAINVSLPEDIASRLGSNTAYFIKLCVQYSKEAVKVCYGFRAVFLKRFGHGTLFNLVNIYGTHIFCGPSFIKQSQCKEICCNQMNGSYKNSYINSILNYGQIC